MEEHLETLKSFIK